LELLERYLQPGMRVADVGTGTGILAIAAAKLGAREVVAVDDDALAVKVAQGNIERNGVAERVQAIVGDGFYALEGTYDLIVCNIISGFLISTAPQVPPLLNAGGVYIVSGTSGRNWRGGVRRAIEGAGFDAGGGAQTPHMGRRRVPQALTPRALPRFCCAPSDAPDAHAARCSGASGATACCA
jgi:ribosomal protein L11 methyltransferase